MKRLLFSKATAVILFCLLAAAVAVAQQTVTVTIKMTINKNGQPVGNVQIALSMANRGKVSVGTSDSNGNVNGVLDIGNRGKIHAEVIIEEDCPNGETRVTIKGPGGTVQTECKKHHKAGGLDLFDGAVLTIDVGTHTITVTNHGTPPMATGMATGTSTGSNEFAAYTIVGGAVGWSNFPNAKRF